MTPSHASLRKPPIAGGGAQLSTPPPPGFQADFRGSSTVAVAPQAAAMAESIGAPRVKQPPASATNGRFLFTCPGATAVVGTGYVNCPDQVPEPLFSFLLPRRIVYVVVCPTMYVNFSSPLSVCLLLRERKTNAEVLLINLACVV